MVLVSAVITTHKRSPDIVERAVKSVVSQTYTNIELLVVDDSPRDYELRDAVKQMVASYPRTTYIAHEKTVGACAARNTGLSTAKGKYIAFLDDDEWFPEKIEKQLTGFADDDVALVYCASEIFYPSSGRMERRMSEVYMGKVYAMLMMDNFIGSTSFPLLKTDCLRAIDGFDVLMQSAQDYDVWLRLSQRYLVNYIDKVLVRCYVHEGDPITKNPACKVAGLERIGEKILTSSKRTGKHIGNIFCLCARGIPKTDKPVRHLKIGFSLLLSLLQS